MSKAAGELSQEDFFYSHLAEHLDGELPPSSAARFAEAAKSPGLSAVPEHFQAMRGCLQLTMQSYYLKDNETQALRNLVQDPSVKATKENIQIDMLGRGEIMGTWMRRTVLAGLVMALVGFLVWRFAPRSGPSFKPLEYLAYEALAMEEDSKNRLDLPTSDQREARQYLEKYPGLDFKPHSFENAPARWKPQGVGVIDYEIAKVAVVQYVSAETKEKLFHFSFMGKLSDLPASETSTMQKMNFKTFASEQLNMAAFQASDNTVAMLVGRRSAAELYQIAIDGVKR